MMHRCFVHLITVLSVLITGCRAQCRNDYIRPLILRASAMLTRDIYSPRYPHHYPDHESCAWKITADPGYVVHVHVAWIDLEVASDCGFDSISLYDGHTSFYPKIAKICTDNTADFYSSSNYMYLKFESDFSINNEGFHLEYSAIRASQVPSTSSSTTTPWWITTRASTTTSGSYDWQNQINTAALIGGLTGGLLLLFVFCALCRYYYSRSFASRRAPRPYYSTPAPTPNAPPATSIYQNNNAVFMVSPASHHLHVPPSHYGGVTNLAFSSYGEAPPAYFAAQQNNAVIPQPGSGGSAMGAGCCPPPPTYTEAMKLSHPPAVTIPAQLPRLGPAPPPLGTAPPPFGPAPPPLGPAPPHFGSVAPSLGQNAPTPGLDSDQ